MDDKNTYRHSKDIPFGEEERHVLQSRILYGLLFGHSIKSPTKHLFEECFPKGPLLKGAAECTFSYIQGYLEMYVMWCI